MFTGQTPPPSRLERDSEAFCLDLHLAGPGALVGIVRPDLVDGAGGLECINERTWRLHALGRSTNGSKDRAEVINRRLDARDIRLHSGDGIVELVT